MCSMKLQNESIMKQANVLKNGYGRYEVWDRPLESPFVDCGFGQPSACTNLPIKIGHFM